MWNVHQVLVTAAGRFVAAIARTTRAPTGVINNDRIALGAGPIAVSQDGVRVVEIEGLVESDLVTNSIPLGRLFTFKDRCKKERFPQTHGQGLRQLFLKVPWDLSMAHLTVSMFLCSSGSSTQATLRT